MKNAAQPKRIGSRILALAVTLMLLLGLCCPAASAESFLSSHKDEIADMIVKVRSDLESLGDDLAAIRDAVRARENGEEASAEENDADSSPLDFGISDMHDNSIEVNVHHDVTVNVDTSRLSHNTITGGGGASRTSSSSGGVVMTTAPKTGDLNNLVLWIVIVAVSALALAAAMFFLLRKKKKK